MTRASLGPHTSIPMSKHMFETLLLGCCCQMFPRIHTDTSPVSCPASLHHPAPAPPEPVPPERRPHTCGDMWPPLLSPGQHLDPSPPRHQDGDSDGNHVDLVSSASPRGHQARHQRGVCAEWPVMTRETKQAPTLPQHSASHQSQHGGGSQMAHLSGLEGFSILIRV